MKKLILNKETITRLSEESLQSVQGGENLEEKVNLWSTGCTDGCTCGAFATALRCTYTNCTVDRSRCN